MYCLTSRCRPVHCLSILLHRTNSQTSVPKTWHLIRGSTASRLSHLTLGNSLHNVAIKVQNSPLRFALSCRLLSGGAPDPKASNSKHEQSDWNPPSAERLSQLKNFPVEPPQFGDEENQTMPKSTISNKIYTLPNALCAFRIAMTPVVGYLIVQQSFDLALTLVAISAVTDFLDGWIARTYHCETKLGALLDPLADKLLVATLTFTLTYVNLIPLFLASLILLRDALILLLGSYLRLRMLPPPRTTARFFDMDSFKSERFRPTTISKVNTGFQLSLVLVTLASPLLPALFTVNPWFLQSLQATTGITTLWSGLYYLTRLK